MWRQLIKLICLSLSNKKWNRFSHFIRTLLPFTTAWSHLSRTQRQWFMAWCAVWWRAPMNIHANSSTTLKSMIIFFLVYCIMKIVYVHSEECISWMANKSVLFLIDFAALFSASQTVAPDSRNMCSNDCSYGDSFRAIESSDRPRTHSPPVWCRCRRMTLTTRKVPTMSGTDRKHFSIHSKLFNIWSFLFA